MKKTLTVTIFLTLLGTIFTLVWLLYVKELQGLKPALLPPKKNIADIIEENRLPKNSVNSESSPSKTPFPLQLPKPDKSTLIRVATPKEGDIVSSPLIIRGEARGYWFFEASFPVRLLDADGNEIAITPATALSEWMTENFVPFEARLEFQALHTPRGTLILQKDNPSGLQKFDDELRIPVRFQSN